MAAVGNDSDGSSKLELHGLNRFNEFGSVLPIAASALTRFTGLLAKYLGIPDLELADRRLLNPVFGNDRAGLGRPNVWDFREIDG